MTLDRKDRLAASLLATAGLAYWWAMLARTAAPPPASARGIDEPARLEAELDPASMRLAAEALKPRGHL